jgi:hypothetical protein
MIDWWVRRTHHSLEIALNSGYQTYQPDNQSFRRGAWVLTALNPPQI